MIRSSKSLEPIRKEYTRKIKTVGAVLVPAQPKRNTQHGITLVALIITIVLLILAGVTVATLTGENGFLTKAGEAKQASKEAEIKERIQLAVISSKTNKLGELKRESLDVELTKEFGTNNYELLLVGEGFLISVNDIEYLVDKDGKVSDGNKVEVSNIENAGDLSKGGQYDGLTEETSYRITCIEDLVEWTNNYNSTKLLVPRNGTNV